MRAPEHACAGPADERRAGPSRQASAPQVPAVTSAPSKVRRRSQLHTLRCFRRSACEQVPRAPRRQGLACMPLHARRLPAAPCAPCACECPPPDPAPEAAFAPSSTSSELAPMLVAIQQGACPQCQPGRLQTPPVVGALMGLGLWAHLQLQKNNCTLFLSHKRPFAELGLFINVCAEL